MLLKASMFWTILQDNQAMEKRRKSIATQAQPVRNFSTELANESRSSSHSSLFLPANLLSTVLLFDFFPYATRHLVNSKTRETRPNEDSTATHLTACLCKNQVDGIWKFCFNFDHEQFPDRFIPRAEKQNVLPAFIGFRCLWLQTTPETKEMKYLLLKESQEDLLHSFEHKYFYRVNPRMTRTGSILTRTDISCFSVIFIIIKHVIILPNSIFQITPLLLKVY